MAERETPRDIQDIDARLERMKSGRVVRDQHSGPVKSSFGGDAARYALEFVAAVGIGFALGWALDGWLGTRPWLMIVIGIMGFIAGVVNVYRAAETKPASIGQRSESKSFGDQLNGGDEYKDE